MNTDEVKKKLHGYIDMIEDETQLQLLNEAAEAYVTSNQPDIIDLLSPDQLKRLQEAVDQADNGKLTSHEEVMKLSHQWLTK
jgi:predicted transcriptional regulator